MTVFVFGTTPITGEAGAIYLRIIWWSILCFFVGRSTGKTVDIQYREAEGKPRFIQLPEDRRWMFHFSYYFGTEVVREGLIIQIVGYVFSAIELVIFFCAVTTDAVQSFAILADWLLIIFAVIVCVGVLLPMWIRYEYHMQIAYDCDWMTHIQEALTIYPRRRCTIISQTGPSTYEIVLWGWNRKKRLAKASIPVIVGSVTHAVHSNEQGSPFWTIIPH